MSDDRRRDGSKPSFSQRDKAARRRGGRDDDGAAPSTTRSFAAKAYRAALERAFDAGTLAQLAATLSRPSGRVAAPAPKEASDGSAPHPAAAPEPDEASKNADKVAAKATKAAPPQGTQRRQWEARVRAAQTPEDITAAVDAYLGKFSKLANDYEFLEKALSHRKTEVVVRVIETLKERLAIAKPRRSRSLAAQLGLLEDTHDDDEVRRLAGELRSLL